VVDEIAPKSGYRRGYAVAILVGLEEKVAAFWRVFSKVVKHEKTVRLEGSRDNAKALYNFHEAIVNALRPTLKEGVRSVILASPSRMTYSQDFLGHVRRHHAWLAQGVNTVTFAEMTGSAVTRSDVTMLTKNPIFRKLLQDATTEETLNLLDLLESKLGNSSEDSTVLYSLEDVEDLVLYSRKKGFTPEFLFLTDKYLTGSCQKSRINRLMQVASNRKVKTRVISSDSPAGKRLSQLGGIVCLAKNI
jgi:stalled ribosome rescue protein Dom34